MRQNHILWPHANGLKGTIPKSSSTRWSTVRLGGHRTFISIAIGCRNANFYGLSIFRFHRNRNGLRNFTVSGRSRCRYLFGKCTSITQIVVDARFSEACKGTAFYGKRWFRV